MKEDKLFWKKYNEKLIIYEKKILDFNNRNEFNFVEDYYYPHARDLVALVITNLAGSNKDPCLKVLDYGSNTLSIANLKNKIPTQEIEYVIYDPFNSNYSKNRDLDFIDYYFVSDNKELDKQHFDLSIFGSSIQYIPEVFDIFGKSYITNSSQILFTHTPLCIDEELILKQHSSFTGNQKLYSYKELKDFFQEKDFDLIFKSALPTKYSAVEKKIFR